MAGSSIMENLFQRTLEDLIKAMRLQLIGESTFISKATEEIRREIKSTDTHTKSTALHKLWYLSAIYGVDMSWASFHVVEVMSSSRFAHKRIGYDAASHSFHDDTPVLLLITNQLRKDLSTNNDFEVSLALHCFSRIATLDLARDLTPEIFNLLSTSRVFVRKRAIAVVLRLFDKYPDAVRVCFKRLVENLESSDPQILTAVIGVFCELASKDPVSYLPLAPEFYRILVDSRNNWVLIKVLKIFSKLAPLEPRLGKRIVEPVCEHMMRSGAQSLIFECVRTVLTCLSDYESAVKLAASKIRELLIDQDPNLRYLGLQALSVAVPKHSWVVSENKEAVIKSLSDEDSNIKVESLHLLMAMVSETNVAEISRVLLNYALKSDPEFCNEILGSILTTCGRNVYEIVVDFDWYVSLLGEMSMIPNCQKGEEIENQLIDIGMRVKDARLQLVRVGRDLLIDPALLGNVYLHRILCAAAWVAGEYVKVASNPFELMDALLQPRTSLLPPSVRAVYINSVFKILIFCLECYILQNEGTASIYSDNLAGGQSELFIVKKDPEAPELATCEGSSYEQDEGFNPRNTTESSEDLSVENDKDRVVTHGQALAPTLLVKKNFMHESIVSLLNRMELILGPLTANQDVEVLERAHNMLAFVQLIKAEIIDNSVQNVDIMDKKVTHVSAIIKLMRDAFSMELGPVSINAQGKVAVPDGLVLKENLDDLKAICGDIELPSSSSFAIGGPHFATTSDASSSSSSNLLKNEDLGPLNESTSLLEHRKRHGLYYLPSEKSEIVPDDYPPANDPKSNSNINDEVAELAKLTEQSLLLKKRTNQTKPRPVVVKLDDGDVTPISVKRSETTNDSLSGAIKDVLLGSEASSSLSRSYPSGKSSSKRKEKKKLSTDLPSEMKENLGEADDLENPNSSSKNHSHIKERRQRGKEKIVEGEEHDKRGKKKSSHRHGRHKKHQRANSPLNAVSQTPVIPDFLL
ncbi:AP-3 complex subunit delta isoform X1 [Gastrolobium bilobum]|uniref:AP-3 complex subunit delta isoform X1 n=1 Tax=Gastrolobium bilobum TaxID=150636 RepID=UPI002AB1143D|nr:AP-3 complex subunit delta isoform X1 [Gastrolobium bilobum]